MSHAVHLYLWLSTKGSVPQVARNNAKTEVSDLQYRMEKSDKERAEAMQELETLREHIDQLQQDCDTYLDEKKTYSTKVGVYKVVCSPLYSFLSRCQCKCLF